MNRSFARVDVAIIDSTKHDAVNVAGQDARESQDTPIGRGEASSKRLDDEYSQASMLATVRKAADRQRGGSKIVVSICHPATFVFVPHALLLTSRQRRSRAYEWYQSYAA